MHDETLMALIRGALDEDLGAGDVTTEATIPSDSISVAALLAKQDLVLAGMDVVRAVFHIVDPAIQVTPLKRDGDRVRCGVELAHISGSTRSLLAGERVALNLLQHLSGIATLTERYVEQLHGLNVRLLDTRKTTPGLRRLEKYAVRVGGGHNHRFNLSDGVLIKDNHIKAAGGIAPAIEAARRHAHHLLKIEVETSTLDEVREALAARADIIMLDNMTLEQMREAVLLIAGQALVEASGNVSFNTIRAIAETGVDLISAGSLTHSAPAVDISMKIR